MVGQASAMNGAPRATHTNIPVHRGAEDPKKLERNIRNAVRQSFAYGNQGVDVENKIVQAIMARVQDIENSKNHTDVIGCSINNDGSISIRVEHTAYLVQVSIPGNFPSEVTPQYDILTINPSEIGVKPSETLEYLHVQINSLRKMD
jgi:hypothetical protein